MENQPLRTPGRPKAPQTIEIQSKFIGSGGVRSDRKSQNPSKITFFSLFSHFPPEIDKLQEFHEFWGNLAKRGSLGGPAPRSLFFLRNIKVSEPPEYRKIARNCYFREISWNFTKFPEISWFVRNFHDSGEISPLLVFWSVSSPPGELKNLNIPIGITRFWACGGQGTYRILQKVIFASFYRFSRTSAKMVKFLVIFKKLMVFLEF